jgi:hypothetical protein
MIFLNLLLLILAWQIDFIDFLIRLRLIILHLRALAPCIGVLFIKLGLRSTLFKASEMIDTPTASFFVKGI